MSNKLQHYYELSEQTAQKIVGKRTDWMDFLDTSSRIYKYNFTEQLLIYSQKPDATACAPIELWNKSFQRWVVRGTKGIALIDETNTRPRLRYVFDVSDTEVHRENAPMVNLWKLKEEHKPLVLAQLAKIYDEINVSAYDEASIFQNFDNIARQLAAEYYEDNSKEIGFRAENSLLEDLDGDNLQEAFVDSVSASIAYVLMTRCGFDAREYFTEEDFDHISSFNTSDTIHALGEATRDLSSQVLKDVELVVKKYERQRANELKQNIENERTVENEQSSIASENSNISRGIRDGIPDGGGLSSPEHQHRNGNGRDAVGQIRDDAEELSEGASQDNSQYVAQPRQAISPLQGNGGTGDGKAFPSDGGTDSHSEPTRQSDRPDGMDSGDEHPKSPSGGIDTGGTDSRLHLNSEESITSFSPHTELSKSLSTSSITLDEVDFILKDGGNSRKSVLRIAAHFAKDLSHGEDMLFLRDEYLKGKYKFHRSASGGKGFQFGNTKISIWFDETGMKIARGQSTRTADDFANLTWTQLTERVRQLYDSGQYVNHDVLEEALHNEHIEMAESLLDLYRDDFRDFREVPENWGWRKKGWPETVATITELLKDRSENGEFNTILQNLQDDVAAFHTEQNATTRLWHDPYIVREDLEKLTIPPKGFPVADSKNLNAFRFITDDEVDSYLTRGSNYSEGKMRILSNFLHNKTPRENEDFLKNEYGHGGGSWANVDDGWHEATPTKGIILRRKGCEDVNLKWNKVAKLIKELVYSGRYMTDRELGYVKNYERLILSRQINQFFSSLPIDGYPESPFPKILSLSYPQESEWEAINSFLDDEAKVDDCIEKIRLIFDNTSTDDRYFKSRKDTLERLTEFRNGTYTLFPNLEKLQVTEVAVDTADISISPLSGSIDLPFGKPRKGHQIDMFEIMPVPLLPSVIEQRAFLEQTEQSLVAEPTAPQEEEIITDQEETAPVDEPEDEIEIAEQAPNFEPEPDFDTISKWALEQVIEDLGYQEALANADRIMALRSHCTMVLDRVITEHKDDYPKLYQSYFYDDYDLNDKLFNYVLRQSWETRPSADAQISSIAVDSAVISETQQVGFPITRAVINSFSPDTPLFYAKAEDGSLYISNGCYIMKSAESDIDAVVRKLNGRRKKNFIEAKENGILLERISELKGNYELIKKPYELVGANNKTSLIFADDKQYFNYNKDLVDIFVPHENNGEVGTDSGIKLFIDDNSSYEASNHGMIFKDNSGNFLGMLLPVQFNENLYEKLADVLPLEIPYKNEFERAKENITHDTYIGREFFDGQETHFVSKIVRVKGEDKYFVPNISYDKENTPSLSRTAIHVDFADMDRQIEMWENSRISFEKQKADNEKSTGESAIDVTVDTSYPDNLAIETPPEQEEPPDKPPSLQKPPNFRITDSDLGAGGPKAKFKANIDAITTLQAIESENRYTTPDEQEILSRYVGWGGLPQAFDPNNGQWSNEYAELKALLTDEEYRSANGSVLNAHYTSPTVISAIYSTVERMGFRAGNLLEPSMGVGNFFGLLPESMRAAKLYGVEIDSITARIAKQLYPNATIREMGYEKTDYPDAFFDVAVGNVPFGDYGVVDKKYDKHKLKIHDYFFAKTLDQVRPGGIIAFITSKGTLDKQNPDVRKYLAQRAELLGAVRLPNTAFKANAGTEVTSDIIFLQKRDRVIDIDADWVHLGQVSDSINPEKTIAVNRYFADNPEMILGQMTTESGARMYGNENMSACIPFEQMPDGSLPPPLAEQLQSAVLNITGQITTPDIDASADIDDLDGTPLEAIPADPDVKNFSFTVFEDTVYYRDNSMMYPVEYPATTLERVKGLVGIRDCVRELIDLQLDDNGKYSLARDFEILEKRIKEKQAELNTLYDSFTKNYGLINSSANNKAFATGQFSDNSYYLLCSLEILDEEGNFKAKGDMFTKRTIKANAVVTSVDTASEALAVSMGEKARVDIEYMSALTGKSEDILYSELRGVIYKNFSGFPDGHFNYVTADEFLSGNIRSKLAHYQKGLEYTPESHPNYATVKHHAEALEKAMPKDLEAHEINLRLGSTWIAPHYVQQFMYGLLQTSWRNQQIYQVRYHSATGEWSVQGKGKAQFNDIPATITYGTKRVNAYQIIDDTLNLKDTRVYDYKTDADGKEIRELNKKETAIAQQKQEQIKRAFKDWIFKDPERRHTLVTLYNEKFNSARPREYDGSHITFSGISPEIKLRPHQLNAIAHILYGGNTLLAHEVGAGKTFEIVAAAMESKRLGLCNKSLIAVPNHLTEQWASEWLRLYPSANILVATKKDFEMRNRRKFIGKIATGDYDAVIIGHTQLEKIPLSKERQTRILYEQIDEISDGIAELTASKGDRFTIKQMARTRKSLEVRLQKLMDAKQKDDIVTFEELGCDRLYVDESHNFKNLMLVTKMRNVAGLSTSDAQKATDLFMKTRYMDEITGGKGVIFATGTPISNSIAELYTIQRYLQYDLLMEKDFSHFDSWVICSKGRMSNPSK